MERHEREGDGDDDREPRGRRERTRRVEDPEQDVAVADHCKGVFVYLGDGKGNWRSASSGLPTIGA